MEYYSCLHIWQICSLPNDVHIRVNVDEVHLLAFTLFFSFRPRAVRGSPTPPRSAGASAQVCRAAGVLGRARSVRRRARRCAGAAGVPGRAPGVPRHSHPSRNAGAGQTHLPEAATELGRKPVEPRLWAKKPFPRLRELLEPCFVATSKQIFKCDFSQRPGREGRQGFGGLLLGVALVSS